MSKYQCRAKWELLYNKFLEQKGTIKEYCSENSLNYRNFRDWCYKFRKLDLQSKKQLIPPKTKKSKFVKLQLPLHETINIRLPNGIIVEVISKNLSMTIKELANVV